MMDEKELLYHYEHQGIALQSYPMLKFHIGDKVPIFLILIW